MPRLIGFKSALSWIASGSPKSSSTSLEAGAVDLVSSPDTLRADAIKYLSELIHNEHDLKDRRTPKLVPMDIDHTRASIAAEDASNLIRISTEETYPAALQLIDLIRRTW